MSLILLDSGQDGGGGDHSPITHTEALRESEALPMRVEIRSSSGQLVQVETATMDEDEIADTTLSVYVRDDGTPVAKGRMDLDGTGGVVHLTQANGSDPTATDPDGTEDTVDLSAGVRSWEHVFSGVTVASGDEVSVKARPETAAGVLSPTERIQEVGASHSTGTQTIHPEVDAQTSQSGGRGTLDLTIYDEQTRITAIEFKKKTSSGGFDATWSTAWDSSTGTAGTDETLTRSEDITLRKKHNVAIKWRITFTDTDGNSQTIATTHELDVDETPEVTTFSGAVDSSLNVTTSGVADEDTATVYVTVTTDGTEPADPDSANADETIDVSSAKNWNSVDTDVDASFDDVVRLKARGETSGGALAGTDHIAEFAFRVSKDDTQVIYPVVDAQTSQSGSTGTLDLTVYDEQTRVTAVEFKKKTDAGGFDASWSTAWDSSTGTAGTDESLTRSESIGLKKKHNVAIKWRVTFTDADGSSQTIATTHEFDVDREPEVKFTGSVDGSLNVLTSGVADEDTATVYVTVTTDGTAPNDPTSTNADETIDVSTSKVWGSVDTDVDASFADVVRMKARGETSGGTLAGADFIEETSFKVEDPPPPSVDIDSFTAFDDGADIDYTVNFTPSSNVSDTDNSVEATFLSPDGTVAATATESSPQTNNSITATDTGAGDGSSTTDDWHKVELELLDSGGSTIETKTTRTLESV